MRSRWINVIFVSVFLCFAVLSGCRNGEETVASAKIFAAVSVAPHAFLLEKIGGERIAVEVLVPAGKEPHEYQPTPEKVAAFSRSKVFFRTGMPFEEMLLEKLKTLSSAQKIIDLREGIQLRPLELHHHEHEHNETDPHIWFAPSVLKKQVETIEKTLCGIDPDGAEYYQKNAAAMLEEIETTRKKIEAVLQPVKEETVFVFHPSYGYFCDEFGLRQIAVEYEGKSPKPKQLAALIQEAKKLTTETHRKPLVFVQPEFNKEPAEALAEAVGGVLLTHSCLEYNVLQSMERFAEYCAAKQNK
ncbi:adhesin [Planctomycetales bacterium]|nr:adhesin [Planctomycetales bacterium]GHT37259.1 adhesin [Planctomycetales bacterium]